MDLEEYIRSVFDEGLSYEDAVQLCFRLFCSVDDIPESIQPSCNKEYLCTLFSRLYNEGFIEKSESKKINNFEIKYPKDEYSHWYEVLWSIFYGYDICDPDKIKKINKRLSEHNKF